ncbi:MAG TPA: hypothetical protein VFO86_16225, partial [Terriglobia bacterium]|nr:hypothetical protein [Terriglobia bacterium]
MSRFENILGACAVMIAPILFTACTSKSPPPLPEKTIEALYAPYVSPQPEQADSQWEKATAYSKSLKKTIDRGIEYSLLLNQPVIEFNPLVAAQNASISNLSIEVDRPPANGTAHVVARFENSNRPTTVGYDMILEDGTWKVDAIRSGKVDLRKSIDDALKTNGSQEEMKAPVKAIYARYLE